MMTKIKLYGSIALGFIAIVFYALLQSEKKKTAQSELKRNKEALKTTKAVNKAALEGVQREQSELNNISSDRTDFH